MQHIIRAGRFVATWFKLNSKRGVTAIEYGLLAALIAVVIISSVTLIGTRLGTTFDSVAEGLPH